MSLRNNIERVERMHQMIRYKRTGTPQQFARKMGVSQSMLYLLLKELKDLGAPIGYCKSRQSYQYIRPVELKFGFECPSLNEAELRAVRGGGSIEVIFP